MSVYTGIRKVLLIPVLFTALIGCTTVQAEHPAFTGAIEHVEQAGNPDPEKAESYSALPEDANLNQILAFAAVNSPAIQAAFHKWDAARVKTGYAGALPDPKLNFSYFLREIETRVGPQQGKVSFSQMIPALSKRSAMEKMALSQAEAAYSEYETVRFKLYRDIRYTYYKYSYLHRSVLLVQENLERLKLLKPVIETSYKAGKAPYSNYIRIQIAIEKESEKLASLNDAVLNITFRLNSMLNRTDQTEFPLPRVDTAAVFSIDGIGEDEYILLLRKFNPELLELEKKIAAAETGVLLAHAEGRPDFMVGTDWAITGRSEMNVEDNGKDPVMVMFGLSIPLNRNKYNSMTLEAEEKLRSMRKMKHNKENMLLADLKITVNELKSSQRRFNLFNTSLIAKAKQSFEVSRTSFQTGNTGFSEMLENIELIIEMQLIAEKEKMLILQKTANIYYMFGEHFLKE